MTDNIKSLFASKYNRESYFRVLEELFSSSLKLKEYPLLLPINNEEVESFHHLGKLTLADNKTLGIYEIQIRPNTRLARNRVQMRNIVASEIQSKSDDGALAVYYDKHNQQWRLSYIAIEYKLDEHVRLTKEQTASKRYTYLLGKGIQARTPIERLGRLAENSTLKDFTDAFAVEPLNKEFYDKLYNWYKNAIGKVKFPNDEKNAGHVENALIRLLTRLLFVWFIKEKGLIDDKLFAQTELKKIIHWDKPDSFYKAILQNLFFATLNKEIPDRGFRKSYKNGRSGNYLITNLYRYLDYFHIQNTEIMALFEKTPFLNGGLFECLDRDATEEEQKNTGDREETKAIRIDGFSDRHLVTVPNALFFNDNGDGLIDILHQYQFTVEESTPLDMDVALDPELLGKVFENLLATYNPETKTVARKSTGSYYTPREIVSYMVDESIKAYLKTAMPSAHSKKNIDELFKGKSNFGAEEINTLIEAIGKIKILDPAVGSGAFPMGILSRLVELLSILDPNNKKWKAKQLQSVEDNESIEAIERVFSAENKYNNYGRKLYLIEKAIYGVDIQPIAIQICKLRFFISLTIEQQTNDREDDNYGIKSLPNLETNFVTANTLIGLNETSKGQNAFPIPSVEEIKKNIQAKRTKIFNAKSTETRKKYRQQETDGRKELAKLLKEKGWPATSADQMAQWDPYNQNVSADWFDAEFMFGINEGFDVVIGNPPYVEARNNLIPDELKDKYQKQIWNDWGNKIPRGSDLLIYFFYRAIKLLNHKGYAIQITQNAWLSTIYGESFQKFTVNNSLISSIIDTSSRFFLDTTGQNINTVITALSKNKKTRVAYKVVDKRMSIKDTRHFSYERIEQLDM